MAEIIIKRKFSIPACGVKMKIYIDGVRRGSVWFNKPFAADISEGRHLLKCETAGIESDEIYFSVADKPKKVECKVGFEKIFCIFG